MTKDNVNKTCRLSWTACANKFWIVTMIFVWLVQSRQNNYYFFTCSKSVSDPLRSSHLRSSHLRSTYLRNSHLRISHPRSCLTCPESAKPTFWRQQKQLLTFSTCSESAKSLLSFWAAVSKTITKISTFSK